MNEMENEIAATIDEFVMRAHTTAGGAWIRACAFLLDLPPVLLGAWILRLALGGVASVAGAELAAWERTALWLVSSATAFWAWDAVWGASRFQATPGKLAHGLRIVTRDKGLRLDFARSSKRAFCKLLPSIWTLARAAALVLALHLLGAATRFAPGPFAIRWLYPAGILLAAVAPSLPAWYVPAWRFNRQYAHDRRAGTLVRAPERVPVRSVALQVAESAAAAVLAMAAVHRLAADPPVPASFLLRGEAESALKAQFSKQFAKAPFRVASVRVRAAAGGDGGEIGAILFATNLEGTVRISRQRDWTDLPVRASADRDGIAGFLDEEAGASRALTAFLAERAAPEPAPSPEAKKAETAAAKPKAVHPGGSATTKDWLRVRFLDADTFRWPDDEPAKTAPWLFAADFEVKNQSDETRFVADWDAVCTVDGKPTRILWLESFEPLHAALAPGETREGTLLFAAQRRVFEASVSWMGLSFAAELPDDPR
ncbi:MAG: RDD family protein [Kiritimatiellae bacterium]|nr:RDD family protein [Kiritimatiellia bacterium]